MERILAINSSISGVSSVSQTLVEYTVQRLLAANPDAVVVSRDLGEAPIPHLVPGTVAGVRGVPTTEDELTAQALSDELIAELQEATILVVGAPMYNFSIPSALRTWFDHVLRPRVTFSYSEAGPQGLLKGIRAIVIQARGGLYSEGPGAVIDFQEPYLKQLLGFVGITDVAFIHAEKIGFGPEAREGAIAYAQMQIAGVVERITSGKSAVQEAKEAQHENHETDYDGILVANLTRVFNERDPERRLEAIRELYADDAIFYETDRSVQGHEAIARVVTELIDALPADIWFSPIRPGAGHHDLGRLQWRAGPPDGPAIVTGTDVARIQKRRIQTIHVFLDQAQD